MNIEPKKYFVQFFNPKTEKIFTLPTFFTDRIKACVHGQDYCRDRQVEDGTNLFFRVVLNEIIVKPNAEEGKDSCPCPEQECCENCSHYEKCWLDEYEEDEDEDEDEEDSEEPDFSVFEEAINLLFGN